MKIVCIGKNYAEHARELNSAVPEEPVFFLKPDTALLGKGQDFFYPSFTGNLHHEIEIVLRFGRMGKHIEPEFAMKYISDVSVGIDFTARDLQEKAKSKGLPWEIAKAFDNAAVTGEWIPVSEAKDLNNSNFYLDINGKKVQEGNSSQMVFSIPSIISYVSKFITFKTGDILFTGTPAGVGAVRIGDRLEGYLDNKKMFDFTVK